MRLPNLLTASLLSALSLSLSQSMLADTLHPSAATVTLGTSGAFASYNVPLSTTFIVYTNNVSDLTEYAAVRGGGVTAVQASVSSTPGYSLGDYFAYAFLVYDFQVLGPANQTVAVNINANGQVAVTGSSGMYAEATLSIGNYSGEFPPIYLDPCENGPGMLQCGDGTSSFVLADTLNVLTNTDYAVVLDAEVGGRSTDIGTASAFVDPTITLATNDSAYSLVFSPGLVPTAATPEPSSLLLLCTGIASAAGFARRRYL